MKTWTVIRIFQYVLVIGGLLLAVNGCGLYSNPSGSGVIQELAHIEQIDVMILESFPVQVHVRIYGLLGDSCTWLDHIDQRRQGTMFFIQVVTARPANALCADVVSPFEETVALDVYGLAAGTYHVDVNGVRESFTLAVDNILPH